MIETRLLTYFLAVAREQNITKAAESLHITQPTLSQQGLGHAYILEHAFVESRYPDLVFRPLEPAIVTPFYLLTKKEAALAPAPREFLELLLEELNQQAV